MKVKQKVKWTDKNNKITIGKNDKPKTEVCINLWAANIVNYFINYTYY
jgi:hypothetical protein